MHYNAIAKGFHWISALIVLGLLPLGFFMVSLDFSPFKLDLYWWHKSFGTLVFFLVWLRLIWRRFNPPPAHMESHKGWETALAKLIHMLLYVAMIGMPLSGIIMSAAADFPRPFFGLFSIPDIVPGKDDALFDLSREAHEIFAYVLLVAVGLHGLGAFKHHIIDRDITLQRMLPVRAPSLGAVIAMFVFMLTVGASTVLVGLHLLERSVPNQQVAEESAVRAAEIVEEDVATDETTLLAPRWQIIKAQSEITFSVNVQGEEFQGQFTDFDGDIYFDPEQLENSKVAVRVKMASVKSGSDERDEYMVMPPWFYAESFTESNFTADKFEKTSENQYVAYGLLTVRDVSLPINVPFSLDIVSPIDDESATETANMQGSFTINRLDYKVGTGDWANPEMVENAVSVSVRIKASRK